MDHKETPDTMLTVSLNRYGSDALIYSLRQPFLMPRSAGWPRNVSPALSLYSNEELLAELRQRMEYGK